MERIEIYWTETGDDQEEWVGSGRADFDGTICGCAAELGADYGDSEDTYMAIEADLRAGKKKGKVTKDDGIYSWMLAK